jgi:putative cardiolipin synthase
MLSTVWFSVALICVSSAQSAAHQVQILEEGHAALEARLRMIDRAQESIVLESFIFEPDSVGVLVLQEVLRKARQGVRVRVLIDDAPLYEKPSPAQVAVLAQAGVEMRFYHPRWDGNLFQMRSHRKLLSVDGREAITGGRNVSRQYYTLHDEMNFLDRDVWISGPVVREIDASFEEFWTNDRAKPAPALDPARRWSRKDKKAFDDASVTLSSADRSEWEALRKIGDLQLRMSPVFTVHQVRYVADQPGTSRSARKVGDAFYALLEGAESRVQLEHAYFVPLLNERSAFRHALKRGVKFRILTNSEHSLAGESRALGNIIRRILAPFADRGVQAYLYSGKPFPIEETVPGSEEAIFPIHSKAAVIDRKTSVIGTFNLDARSYDYNAEMMLVFPDHPELAAHLERRMESRIAFSHRLLPSGGVLAKPGEIESPGVLKQLETEIRGFLGRALTPLL